MERWGPLASVRRRPLAAALALSAALSAVYLLVDPRPLDLAAQVFRAGLFERDGFVVWNDAWYGGHLVPGYGVLYPPLGALLGPELLGVACALASTALFAALAAERFGSRAWLGIVWFGAASTVALWGGRTTFALGVTLGLLALLLLQRERRIAAPLAAFATALASPVAGLFVAIAAGGTALSRWRPSSPDDVRGDAAAVAGAAAVGVLALSLAFPTPGWQPFELSAFLWVPLVCAVAFLAAPADWPALRWAAGIYLVVAIAAVLIDTPLGGNVVRLGTTFAGPVLAIALLSRKPVLLALLALPLLWWQWTATVRDVVSAEGDPSTRASFYEPLVAELDALAGGEPVRVEIPPTRNRWEAAYVADDFPIGRGWLRQMEAEDFELFTDGRLTPVAYQQWLYEHGIAYVALPAAERDYLGEDEAALLATGGLPFLREVWANEDWTLWEVRSSDGTGPPRGATLASGGAVVTGLGPDRISVDVPGPGDYLLRIRYSPYLTTDDPGACLEDAGGSSTRLQVSGGAAREIEVDGGLSVDGLIRREPACG